MAVAGALTFGLLLVMLIVPVPFAVQGAGPTFDTIGGHDGPGEGGDSDAGASDGEDPEEPDDAVPPLISVEGAEFYPPNGELRLTTVVTAGGPGYPVRAANVIEGWLSRSRVIQPVETTIDPTLTQEERDTIATQQMITSQEHAIVSALTEVGYDVPVVLRIAGAAPGTGADGVVEVEDEIVAIETPDGEHSKVGTYADLAGPLAATAPQTSVTLVVERDGQETELEIVTGDDGRGGSLLGVFLEADFDMPVEVEIAIDNVGGPSAGMMFALGIVDVLTPGDLTGGAIVAGTGTISLDGRVGPIGGVSLKLIGAVDDDAEYFLSPLDNCDEVVGNVPAGLQVIAVETLEEARLAVEAIAADDAEGLPTCTG